MRLKVSVTNEACDYITLYNIKKKKRNIESEKKTKIWTVLFYGLKLMKNGNKIIKS